MGRIIIENDCTILQTCQIGNAEASEEADMDSMHHQQAERETHRAQASRDELVELIRQALREDGTVEPLKGLHLHRSSSPNIAFIT